MSRLTRRALPVGGAKDTLETPAPRIIRTRHKKGSVKKRRRRINPQLTHRKPRKRHGDIPFRPARPLGIVDFHHGCLMLAFNSGIDNEERHMAAFARDTQIASIAFSAGQHFGTELELDHSRLLKLHAALKRPSGNINGRTGSAHLWRRGCFAKVRIEFHRARNNGHRRGLAQRTSQRRHVVTRRWVLRVTHVKPPRSGHICLKNNWHRMSRRLNAVDAQRWAVAIIDHELDLLGRTNLMHWKFHLLASKAFVTETMRPRVETGRHHCWRQRQTEHDQKVAEVHDFFSPRNR